ncbi:MAG: SPFH/Band 7/PHB domain protein [Candidatus Kapabacteria bacterium]|nr:SPFH/Band 7/PHB domain protein [Candidatus Kapabacteria bacterium]
MATPGVVFIVFLIVFALIIATSTIKMVSQATVKIIERLGKYHKTAESGLNIIVPFIDKVRATLDLREQLIDVPPQSVITRDNVTMEVDCVVYWQVVDPVKAVYEIYNVMIGIEQMTRSSLRSVIGELDLDHTLSGRDTINAKLRGSLDAATDKWGVKVMRVEVRNIVPPEDIRITMEKQMTAERNKRATILISEGEKQSQILKSEGQQQAAIISAEGYKQSQILQADGQAEARMRVATAEAQAIRLVTGALKETGSNPGNYLITMKYLESWKEMSNNANKLVFIPYESAAIMGSIGGIKEMMSSLEAK